jgi:hypothetical protein
MRRILAVCALAAAGLLAAVLPASAASVFIVTDNHGALVTRQPVTAGEEIIHAGVAYTVQTVQGSNGTYLITVTPRLPVSDWGKQLAFAAT